MKDKLAFEAFYPHPPERVWKALTDPKALGKWFMPGDFKPVKGHRFQFDGLTRGGRSTVEGVVLEVEPETKLSYTWDDGEAGSPSVVTWSLHPKNGGTQLRLEHQALVAEPVVLIEASMNWRYMLYASLPVLLQLLRDQPRRPPTPIVYVEEQPQTESKRRAGFRQDDEALCR